MSDITVTECRDKQNGLVLVKATGFNAQYDELNRRVAAHSRTHKYGRRISGGGSVNAGMMTVTSIYNLPKE